MQVDAKVLSKQVPFVDLLASAKMNIGKAVSYCVIKVVLRPMKWQGHGFLSNLYKWTMGRNQRNNLVGVGGVAVELVIWVHWGLLEVWDYSCPIDWW